jgi:hypothetical protein
MEVYPGLELFFKRLSASSGMNTIGLSAIRVLAETVVDMLGENPCGLGVGFMYRRAADLLIPQIAKPVHHFIIRHPTFPLPLS